MSRSLIPRWISPSPECAPKKWPGCWTLLKHWGQAECPYAWTTRLPFSVLCRLVLRIGMLFAGLPAGGVQLSELRELCWESWPFPADSAWLFMTAIQPEMESRWNTNVFVLTVTEVSSYPSQTTALQEMNSGADPDIYLRSQGPYLTLQQ